MPAQVRQFTLAAFRDHFRGDRGCGVHQRGKVTGGPSRGEWWEALDLRQTIPQAADPIPPWGDAALGFRGTRGGIEPSRLNNMAPNTALGKTLASLAGLVATGRHRAAGVPLPPVPRFRKWDPPVFTDVVDDSTDRRQRQKTVRRHASTRIGLPKTASQPTALESEASKLESEVSKLESERRLKDWRLESQNWRLEKRLQTAGQGGHWDCTPAGRKAREPGLNGIALA